jgi:hypothetical protein
MSSDAEAEPESGRSLLTVKWMLLFDEAGGQGKARLKIRKERRAQNGMNTV